MYYETATIIPEGFTTFGDNTKLNLVNNEPQKVKIQTVQAKSNNGKLKSLTGTLFLNA